MLSLGIGVNGRKNVSLYDASALAFINATGLTGTTEKTAVNNLVKNLKSYGLWSKMKAIYPFVSDQKNLSSYTEDFNSVGWQKAGNTVTVDTTIAPDGTTTADTVNTTAAGANYLAQQINVTPSTSYLFSFYAIKGTNSTPKYRVYNNSGSADIVAETSYGSLINTSTWTRVTVSFSTPANCTSLSIYLLANGFAGTTILWGSQLEIGSTATTYQKTSTTASSVFVQQFKYNLKDARDLDAAFRLAFNGTWTYSKQGATPNGVNAYTNTYFNPVSNGLTTASAHLSYYARTAATTTDPAEIGNYTNNNVGFVIQSKSSLGLNIYYYSYTALASRSVATAPTGLMAGSSVANTRRDLYLNGVSVANNTTTDNGTLGNYNMYMGAANINNTSVASYSNSQTAFATIGNGLTDSEMANLYTSVQLFQQELSRYVGVPIVSDANAQAFLNAAVITDQTQANAVNTLVTDLKTYGLWTKMKAIYPFVGGTATTHKWNLKDPRDLDAAYRLAFSGAWTHSSTGALPNGANAYANTFFNQQGNWTSTSNGAMGLYLRTNSVGAYCDMGAGTISSGSNSSTIYARFTGDVVFSGLNCTAVTPGSANTNSQGFHAVSRTNSTSYSRYKRGTSTIDVTNTDSIGTNINRNIYLGAGNDAITAASYSNREIAYSFLSDGLTQSEIDLYYTAVNKFQTSLSRNV